MTFLGQVYEARGGMAADQRRLTVLSQIADSEGLLGRDQSSLPTKLKSAFMSTAHFLARPNYAVAGAFDVLGGTGRTGETLGGRVLRELFGEGDREFFGDVLEQQGYDEGGRLSSLIGDNFLAARLGLDPTMRGSIGLAMDIFLDPTTYLSLASNQMVKVITKGGKAIGLTEKALPLIETAYRGRMMRLARSVDRTMTTNRKLFKDLARPRDVKGRFIKSESFAKRVEEAIKIGDADLEAKLYRELDGAVRKSRWDRALHRDVYQMTEGWLQRKVTAAAERDVAKLTKGLQQGEDFIGNTLMAELRDTASLHSLDIDGLLASRRLRFMGKEIPLINDLAINATTRTGAAVLAFANSHKFTSEMLKGANKTFDALYDLFNRDGRLARKLPGFVNARQTYENNIRGHRRRIRKTLDNIFGRDVVTGDDELWVGFARAMDNTEGHMENFIKLAEERGFSKTWAADRMAMAKMEITRAWAMDVKLGLVDPKLKLEDYFPHFFSNPEAFKGKAGRVFDTFMQRRPSKRKELRSTLRGSEESRRFENIDEIEAFIEEMRKVDPEWDPGLLLDPRRAIERRLLTSARAWEIDRFKTYLRTSVRRNFRKEVRDIVGEVTTLGDDIIKDAELSLSEANLLIDAMQMSREWNVRPTTTVKILDDGEIAVINPGPERLATDKLRTKQQITKEQKTAAWRVVDAEYEGRPLVREMRDIETARDGIKAREGDLRRLRDSERELARTTRDVDRLESLARADDALTIKRLKAKQLEEAQEMAASRAALIPKLEAELFQAGLFKADVNAQIAEQLARALTTRVRTADEVLDELEFTAPGSVYERDIQNNFVQKANTPQQAIGRKRSLLKWRAQEAARLRKAAEEVARSKRGGLKHTNFVVKKDGTVEFFGVGLKGGTKKGIQKAGQRVYRNLADLMEDVGRHTKREHVLRTEVNKMDAVIKQWKAAQKDADLTSTLRNTSASDEVLKYARRKLAAGKGEHTKARERIAWAEVELERAKRQRALRVAEIDTARMRQRRARAAAKDFHVATQEVRSKRIAMSKEIKELKEQAGDKLTLKEAEAMVLARLRDPHTRSEVKAIFLHGAMRNIGGLEELSRFVTQYEDIIMSVSPNAMRRVSRKLSDSLSTIDPKSGQRWVEVEIPRVKLDPKKAVDKAKGLSHVRQTDVWELPEGVAREVEKWDKSILKSPEAQGIFRLYDILNNTFKEWVTAPWLAFHVRNAYANVAASSLDIMLQSINPFRHKEAIDILRGMDGTITTKSGRRITYAEVRSLLEANDIYVDFSQLVEHMDTVGRKVLVEGNNAITRPIRRQWLRRMEDLGRGIEQEARALHFVTLLRRGKSGEEAADIVKSFLFDYNNLSTFEKDWMRRIFPFYTWQSKNIRRQVRNVIEHPGRVSAQIKPLMDRGPENDMLPEYLRGELLMRLEGDAQTPAKFIANIDFPVTEIGQLWQGSLDKTFMGFINQMNPLLKSPLELAFNMDSFTGRTIKGRQWMGRNGNTMSKWAKVPGGQALLDWLEFREIQRADGTTGHTANGTRVYLAFKTWAIGRMLNQAVLFDLTTFGGGGPEDIANQRAFSFMKLISGLEFREYDLNQAQKEILRNRIDRLEQLLIDKGVAAQFTKTFIPKSGVGA